MTLFLARRGSDQPWPMPLPGAELWLEDLPVGPVGTIVGEVRGARVRVEPPTLDGCLVDLPVGLRLVATYVAAEVPCEARVAVSVAEQGDTDGTWLLVEAVERMQRRAAVRVPAQLIARVATDRDGEHTEQPEQSEAGITEDLSASGVLMRLRVALPLGATVRLAVHCGGAGGDVDVLARVVRVEHDERSARPYRTALSFPELTGAAERRLVRFLFDRQRMLRRREIGLD